MPVHQPAEATAARWGASRHRHPASWSDPHSPVLRDCQRLTDARPRPRPTAARAPLPSSSPAGESPSFWSPSTGMHMQLACRWRGEKHGRADKLRQTGNLASRPIRSAGRRSDPKCRQIDPVPAHARGAGALQTFFNRQRPRKPQALPGTPRRQERNRVARRVGLPWLVKERVMARSSALVTRDRERSRCQIDRCRWASAGSAGTSGGRSWPAPASCA